MFLSTATKGNNEKLIVVSFRVLLYSQNGSFGHDPETCLRTSTREENYRSAKSIESGPTEQFCVFSMVRKFGQGLAPLDPLEQSQ